jgi:hypothetical protein
MSDTIILRKVYALNYLTGQFLSSGQNLVTDGVGGTVWIPILSTLNYAGGSVIGNLPSTVSTTSSGIYSNQQAIITQSTLTGQAISTLSANLALILPSTTSGQSLLSTQNHLGSVGYISTSQLVSTVDSLTSVATLGSNLSPFNFVSTLSLTSTVVGLGSAGYLSTTGLMDLFTSTVTGLGSSGYVSTLTLRSTVANLGTTGFISTASLISSLEGLGQIGYVSTKSLISANRALGSLGYVSTSQLVSTTQALSSMKANIRFDNTTTVNVTDAIVTFTNVGTVIYTSTVFMSTIMYSGNNNTTLEASIPKTHDLQFSTASMNFTGLGNLMNSNSRVTIDIFPTIAFTKLATGATNVAMLPISSLLQVNQQLLYSTTVVSYLYCGNTQVFQTLTTGGNTQITSFIDASNIWNQPIRITVPKATITDNIDKNFSLVHYLPSSLNNGAYQNALHSNLVTPFFASTNSIYVTIQNQA